MAAKVVKLDKTKYENDAIGFRRLEAAVFDLDRWASLSLFLSVEATQEESVAEWQHLVLE